MRLLVMLLFLVLWLLLVSLSRLLCLVTHGGSCLVVFFDIGIMIFLLRWGGLVRHISSLLRSRVRLGRRGQVTKVVRCRARDHEGTYQRYDKKQIAPLQRESAAPLLVAKCRLARLLMYLLH